MAEFQTQRHFNMKRLLFVLAICFSLQAIGQSAFADSLIDRTLSKMRSVPAYECNILIDMDVNFINIDQRKGKIFFLPPDSIRYEIKGFAFLPKKGFNDQAYAVTEGDYVALHLGEEMVKNVNCQIIKVVPNDIEADVVLGQFWIDANDRIRKMIIVTKEDGNYEIELEYGQSKYPVPSKMKVNFNSEEMNLPKTMTGDLEADEEAPKKKGKKKKGSITITYSDYKFK